ncbi:MAG: hypothetical protein JW947_09065 [Sedimentisphaerales bacterium]|nr:hypothetical protein [Sedimentisphaerales bacterium]
MRFFKGFMIGCIIGLAILGVISLFTGCESLRFAPSETQKQNAWLHNRTAAITAEQAKDENTSEQLQNLAGLSEAQSWAFVSYNGLPAEFPQAETAEDVLSQSSRQITQTAIAESAERPDTWEVADSLLELAIGISALFGGAYGIKLVQFLRDAQTKSKALQEIVKGNELFKKKQPINIVEEFKEAQTLQSPETRQVVTEIKSG